MQDTQAGLTTQIVQAQRKLYGYWRGRQSLACYDRRDFQGHPAMLRWAEVKAQGKRWAMLPLQAVNVSAFLAPVITRRLLGVKPEVYSGALAFLVSALTECHKLDGDPSHLSWAEELLPQLLALRGSGDKNVANPATKAAATGVMGWGLPYDWASFQLVPAGTPIGYTTALAGEAFLDYHQATSAAWALDEAAAACHFLATGLNQTPTPGGGIALSYTKLDHSTVANTNSLEAALLLETGAALGNGEWNELGTAIMRYVAGAQQPDGRWCYSTPGTIIDHYHTSMTIHGLNRARRTTAGALLADVVDPVLRRGLDFHLRHLWDGPIPKHDTRRLWPVEALAPAEAIITFAGLWPYRHEFGAELTALLEQRWHDTLAWLLPAQGADGTFPTVFYKLRHLRLRSLRWADAQILRALALSRRWLAGKL